MEIAPGAPLNSSVTPPAVADDRAVEISISPAAKEEIVETLKSIEQKPAETPKNIEQKSAAPMKLIIDPPRPKPATPPAPKAPAPQPVAVAPARPAAAPVVTNTPKADTMAALPSIVTESAPLAKPLPELLCPGEDPRQYGSLKSAKSLEPKPTYTAAEAYRPAGGSRIKAPAIAAAAVILLAVGFGIWHYSKAPAASPQAQTRAAEPPPTPAPVVTTTTVPVEASKSVVPAATPAAVASKVVPEKKPTEAKAETAKAVPAAEAPQQQAEQPAMLIQTAKHTEAAPAPAPMLAVATPEKMPDLGTPKLPAASLLVKRTTATPPVVLHQVAPVYPEIARHAGTSGDVRMQVTISATGKVSNVKVIDGYPVLRQAASSAVSQWQYRPATLDGKPVESTMEVVVKFAAR